ncbi:hypothetical protein ASPACDRAFT_1889733 [Aspergillus aculeatus ATCC 16872]|uniref:Carrier domain-containing protein n=1 Tax=Aspergillus aculeatus (strain ATCC 16872 / CBS 172.66 / WB 5094) TaxID=690307 RepID=A0A1L9WNP7_ASPA1|nr:uncharacterized protein ASPACDRAFT_1889733 [Aspergillus aculeatus ATCC 16872]OJJ97802.1 hypothetical protein ASPACDRAFT_1889733 [Aspergillus aculeatus ATCC 16872]
MDSDSKPVPLLVDQREATDPQGVISLSSVAAYIFVGKTESMARVLVPEMWKAGARTFIFITESTSPSAARRDIIQGLRAGGATAFLYEDCLSHIDRLKTVLGLWNTNGRRIGGVVYDQTDAVAEDLDDVLYHAAGMQSLHESTAALELDFLLTYSRRDTPAAAMAKHMARHRSAFGLPFVPLELETGPDAVEAQVLSRFRLVFSDPAQSAPTIESVYSSSSGETAAQTGLTTPDGFGAGNWSPSISRSSSREDCDQRKDQDVLPERDCGRPPSKSYDGNSSLFDSAAEQIASLLSVEVDEVDQDAPIAALGVDSLIANAFCNWLATEVNVRLPPFEFLEAGSLRSFIQRIIHSREGF